MSDTKIGRRDFLSYSAVLGAAGIVGLSSCKGGGLTPLRKPGDYYVPELTDKADAGRELKVGLVGCGGRGRGALNDLLAASDSIKVVALGDTFSDPIEKEREELLENHRIKVDDDKCFVGFDAYKKVIDSGVDMVILATPPCFRPEHFSYATSKGVHSFLEKPIAVDPAGYRLAVATAKQAEAKGLSVVTGTQRHHQRCYVEAFKKIQEGYIGEIRGGNVYWNQGALWFRERGTQHRDWSDMELMIRDWVNWEWLSGDHIVEQHVHNIDVFLWMTGLKLVKATGFGARHRRYTGDQFDQFSVDFEFENGIHLHSMCCQIDGFDTEIREIIHGSKGSWDSATGEIKDLDGNVIWKFDYDAEDASHSQTNPYVLEHVDWVNHIRRGETHVEAELTAMSCMAAIMGRESAYSGKEVLWDDMVASDLCLMPEKLAMGPMDMSKFKVPVPGEDREKVSQSL
ncbi:MAG: Gfo/Idh/MocA family oxidoreductase [Bacteroidales bacterium]|nr:Gfo/Idh/MocA family oxidoreductase [Bacteroidales bacterium]